MSDFSFTCVVLVASRQTVSLDLTVSSTRYLCSPTAVKVSKLHRANATVHEISCLTR